MKKILTCILCVMLLIALSVPALATPHRMVGDALCIPGVPGKVASVTVNGQPTADFRFSTVEDSQTPILYYCIVDPSSSLAVVQITQQKDVLTALNQNMRPCDRMVLAMMGSKALEVGPILETQEARQQAIDAKWTPASYTRLYQDILTAIEDLTTNAAYESYYPCAVLISDGINEGGKTLGNAQTAIRESGILLHAVGVVCDFPTPYALTNADHVTSLASKGAVACTPLPEEVEPAVLGQQIAQSMLQDLVMELDTTHMDRSAAQQSIALSVPTSDGIWEAQLELAADQLPELPVPEPTPPETTEATEAAEPETEETTPPETFLPEPTIPETMVPETIPTESPVSRSDCFVYLAAGGILLIFLAVFFFFYFQHKREQKQIDKLLASKHKSTSPDAPVPAENPQDEELDLLAWAKTFGLTPLEEGSAAPIVDLETLDAELAALARTSDSPVQKSTESKEPVEKISSKPAVFEESVENSASIQPAIPAPGCHVTLTATVDREWSSVYFLPTNEPKTFGRGREADFQINETDYGLSNIHFEMLWDGRCLHIRDSKSFNGTALNNIPLTPGKWVRIKKNPVILAGAYEYKITSDR